MADETERELYELAERLGYVSSIAEVREVPAATLERLDTSAADLASMARLMAFSGVNCQPTMRA